MEKGVENPPIARKLEMPCGIRRSYLGSPTRFFLLLASVLPFVSSTSLVITRFSLKFARTKHLGVSEEKKRRGDWVEWRRREKRLNEGRKRRERKVDKRGRKKETSNERRNERGNILVEKRCKGRNREENRIFFWTNSSHEYTQF